MVDKALIYEVHFSNIIRYVVPLAKHLIDNSIAGLSSFIEQNMRQELAS